MISPVGSTAAPVKIGRLVLERVPLYDIPEEVVERLGRTGGGNETEGATLVDGTGGREGT
jgi:hypothetical protein